MLKTVSSITNAIGAINYKGTWNASTNSPTLASGVGVKGDYYVVSVSGSTNLDGISNWGVGDWAVFSGANWQRVEGGADLNGVNLSVSGVTNLSALVASTALALDTNKNIVSVGNTGSGDNVLATSPTLITPVLGVASATSIAVAAGTVGAPSITTVGDTDTGVFFPAADVINFVTNGAVAGSFNAAGRFATSGFVFNTNTGSIADAGTIDISTANTGGGGYMGILFVGSVLATGALTATRRAFIVLGRGTTCQFTQLATQNGTTAGSSFDMSCPSNGVLRATNTSGGTRDMRMSLISLSSP
jgi:hypothetical protein